MNRPPRAFHSPQSLHTESGNWLGLTQGRRLWVGRLDMGYRHLEFSSVSVPRLQLALRMKPDAIYLLTDGVFSADVVDKVINAQKETKKIPIHTIAFEDMRGAMLLEMISRATGGQHQYVQ